MCRIPSRVGAHFGVLSRLLVVRSRNDQFRLKEDSDSRQPTAYLQYSRLPFFFIVAMVKLVPIVTSQSTSGIHFLLIRQLFRVIVVFRVFISTGPYISTCTSTVRYLFIIDLRAGVG